MENRSKTTKIELILIFILVSTGFILRIWKIDRVGIDHFDEGVYVFSALGLSDPSQPYTFYPDQYKFSPPGYFSLVSLSYILSGGPSDTAAIMVNVVFGTLSIMAIWWLGRNLINPAAGVIAATLLALNEYHIALSRTALTDVSFTFFLMLAIGAILRLVYKPNLLNAILAGLLVGIAWNFKYHGWFAIFIASLALIPYLWFNRKKGLSLPRIFFLWIIMVIVAFLCFLPWFYYIQTQPGGFLGLLNYQHTLISRQEYLQKLWVQIQQQLLFEGVFSRASVPLAMMSLALISPINARVNRRFWIVVVVLTISAIFLGASGVSALLSFLGIYWLLRKPTAFPVWFLYGWLGVWAVMTPFYHPYARLVLPFTVASFIGMGYFLTNLFDSETETEAKIAFPWRTATVGMVTVAFFATCLLIPGTFNPWRSSRSMSDAVLAMLDYIPEGSRVIVIGEPSAAFYLHLNNRPAFGRMDDPQDWKLQEQSVYFLTGVYAQRAQILQTGLADLNDRLQLIRRFPVFPNAVRVMDDSTPDEYRQYTLNPDGTFTLSLYYLEGTKSP